MLKRLCDLPTEKEKRILVSGEGQEAVLVAYYLAKHKKLLE
jgi:thioredoxin reductase